MTSYLASHKLNELPSFAQPGQVLRLRPGQALTRPHTSVAGACEQAATPVSLQAPPPCVSFKKQQRLACNRRFLPGWIARKRKFTSGLIRHGSQNTSPSSWTATAAGRKRRHLPRVAGHRAGVTSVRSTVETAARIGIPCADAVRVFGRKLEEASPQRSRFPDGPAVPLSEGGSSDPQQEQYPAGIHRTPARASAFGAGEDGMGAGGDRAQHRHGADPGAELQRAHGTGGCISVDRRRGGPQWRSGPSGDR